MKCIDCKKEITQTYGHPIFKKGTECGDQADFSGKYICRACLRESLDYAVCLLCGVNAAYHAQDLKDDCCAEHREVLDDEEAEDMESYTEYRSDPNHWEV